MSRSISSRAVWLGLSLAVVLWAPRAQAQYANQSLGLGVSFIGLSGGDHTTGVGPMVPLVLEGHLYLENGFDMFLQVPVGVVYTTGNADTQSHDGLVFATGGDLGFRYLFLEENLRPWVALYFTTVVLVGLTTYAIYGPGAAAGLDYFVNDSTSIGLRAFFNLYVEINQPPAFGPGGALNVAFYF